MRYGLLSTIIFLCLLVTYQAVAQPQANFQADKEKICSGKEVHFYNTSVGAQKYRWYKSGLPLNYTLFSTSKDTAAVFTAGTYYIRMVATDTASGLSDTSLQIISVRNPGTGFVSYLHYAACKGDTMTFKAHYEAINIKWTFNLPQTIVGGCDTCALLKFITYDLGNELTNTTIYDGGCMETTTYTYSSELTPCWPTAITKLPDNKELQVYPNPVADALTVETPDGKIPADLTLYNITGAAVYHGNAVNSKQSIQMEGMPAGIYLLQVRMDNTVLQKRIVKY